MSSTTFGFLRLSNLRMAGASPLRAPWRWGAGAAALLVLGVIGAGLRGPDLPANAAGTLAYVSDRSGLDSIYVRRLPGGRERRVVSLREPARDPALSPDGRRIAFSVGGRIGVVDLETDQLDILTLGTEWRDSSPAWMPDGTSLIVCAARADTGARDLHQLQIEQETDGSRRPLTTTPFLDESDPVVSADGQHAFFVREDNVFRLDVADGSIRRLTGGFKKARSPRLLPSGRIVFLWTEGKEYGVDIMDADGGARQTVQRGSTYYRSLAASPDGRYLAATYTFDLSFHLLDLLSFRQREKLHLLDLQGSRVAEIADSWRYANHSAAWSR